MQVSDVMQRDFFTVRSTESVEEAANKMREKHLRTVVVVEEDHVRGILTEKEIQQAMIAAASPQAGPAVIDDGNRCCYFNDVQAELLLNR